MVSVGVAALAFVALSGVSLLVFRGERARALLESRVDGERTISILFASLRNYEDFGTAIEAMPILSSKVIGIAIFAKDQSLLYAWGKPPAVATDERPVQIAAVDRWNEKYVENPRNDSTILLLRPSPAEPPPPVPPEGRRGARGSHSFMFETLRDADLITLEVRQPDYWRSVRMQTVLFPAVEVLLAALVIFVRFLLLRNIEYRARIEQQKNLVLVGTAASTLAHEIKNPLLAIRLQSGILARTLKGQGSRELAIIDDEVDRLSMLSQRINDILRDPAGNPGVVDVADIAAEVGTRLCGRSIVGRRAAAGAPARIDPERLRSVLENLVRNALESGGKAEDVTIEITAAGGQVVIDVLDRGGGLPQKDRARLFDPFFTTKSKGAGIGLVVCRRFINAAGGRISLEDRQGGGCRARVTLPAAPAGERA